MRLRPCVPAPSYDRLAVFQEPSAGAVFEWKGRRNFVAPQAGQVPATHRIVLVNCNIQGEDAWQEIEDLGLGKCGSQARQRNGRTSPGDRADSSLRGIVR